MPGNHRSGDLPPDVPPEYAEAYRRGYSSAYADAPADGPGYVQPEPPYDSDPARRRLLAPAILVGLALVLVLGAYGVGTLFSAGVSGTDTTEAGEPDGVVVGGAASESADGKPKKDKRPQDKRKDKPEKRYAGAVQPAAISGATVSCQSDSSVDSSGATVTYDPANMYDQDVSTAWRCDGNGRGEQVTVELPDETTIGEVGLVPGYAKTDATSGADRYAENNRLTRVRWVFDDGTRLVQRLEGSADNRAMQTMRIPETDSASVTVEILRSVPGPRNTVAISEVRIGAVS